MKRTAERLLALAAVLALASLPLGCGDDEGTNPSGSDQGLVGTWVATSFTAGGMDVLAGGLSFSITFMSDGNWSSTVAGDASGFFCDSGTACTDGGTYVSTASTLTLDPGTVDEVVLNYTLSGNGNTATLTGSIEGNAVTAVFTKI